MFADSLDIILKKAIMIEKRNAIEEHGKFNSDKQCEDALSEEIAEFMSDVNQAKTLICDWWSEALLSTQKDDNLYMHTSQYYLALVEQLTHALYELIQVHAVIDKIADFESMRYNEVAKRCDD